MARVKSYKITFRDREVKFNLVGYEQDLGNSVPIRFIEEEQMELLNLMLLDHTEPSFGCTEEEFYNSLTPKRLKGYRELRSDEFKIKKV